MEALVRLQELLVVREPALGDRMRVGAEEELDERDVAQLGARGVRVREPGIERRLARGSDREAPPPPADLLALLADQPGLRQPLGLGVELRVGERPEVPDGDRVHLLEVVGRARPGGAQEAEDHGRGGCERGT